MNMNMKKTTAAILSLALVGAVSLPVFAAEPMVISPAPASQSATAAASQSAAAQGYTLTIDGKKLDVKVVPKTDADGKIHVMVPLRPIAEALGYTVTWHDDYARAENDEVYADFNIGEDLYFKSTKVEDTLGSALFSLGVAPYVEDGVSYVPLEVFDSLLGCVEGMVTVTGTDVVVNTQAETSDKLAQMVSQLVSGQEQAETDGEEVQLPNPFEEYETKAEAAKAAGFELTLPDGLDQPVYRVISGELLEVIAENSGDELCIRKASGDGDISGDYNVYGQESKISVDGASVTMKGNDGKVLLAIWTRDGYAFSVSSEQGVTAEAMTALIEAVR